ncbi:sigma-70 family RNA polymerase sigma factor [Robiginitalea sp. SC105]|uniref:sigma-70 family RNA polymerase sigma factor n=1 Tax=Robiginitalea sp. SC105 TaxID=2762332 RepID=UPI00163B27BE|nr:sigma-70 family RNA polymerase sigma factor [Robiginitalea sp. SC105]MBC2839590.1 sigma-70 family RNA polymerase sigma factor [Robiginitalea sp. SC105]
MTQHALHPETWVDRYADYLFNYAVVRVNDDELARDLVQETFVAGLQSAVNFKGNAAERTWLVAILKRKVIDHYRKSNTFKGQAEVKMHFPSQSDQEGDWLEQMAADPETTRENDPLENEELGLAIRECLARLPEKQALVFTLKTIRGMSTEDVCKELDINPSNLWVIVHRARTSLMGCLNQTWFN